MRSRLADVVDRHQLTQVSLSGAKMNTRSTAASAVRIIVSLLFLVALLEPSNCLSAEPVVWSSQLYPNERLGPTSWRYYRVDLPTGFAALSISLTRKWEDDEHTSVKAASPLVCFGFNGPPLAVPPVAEKSLLDVAIAAGELRDASVSGKCGWFNETVEFNVSNFEILEGLMHIGIYSDIGATRTQSHMISRGKEYKFALDVQVLRCSNEEYGGPECKVEITNRPPTMFFESALSNTPDPDLSDETKVVLAPAPIGVKGFTFSDRHDMSQASRTDRYSGEECVKLGETRYLSLRVESIQSEMLVKFECDNSSSSEGHPGNQICQELSKNHGIVILIRLRYGALPSEVKSDYTRKLSSGPILVDSPRRGLWYLSMTVSNISSSTETGTNIGDELCLTMNWGSRTCESDLFGNSCQWTVLPLERVLLPEIESPFDSYYFPANDRGAIDSGSRWFSLLSPSNTSYETWDYFTMEVPTGASGGVLSIFVSSPAILNTELYARFGNCPTTSNWEFRKRKADNLEQPNDVGEVRGLVDISKNVSVMEKEEISKYSLDLVYPNEGTWCFGLRHNPAVSSDLEPLDYNAPPEEYSTEVQIILHGCPNKCSGHGKCRPDREAGRLHFISHCTCDVAHGDFDCSAVLVAPGEKMQQTWILTFSNAAAILPSVWAIRHQAYAEWITFMLSGMASGIYHSCDSGGWCAMPFSTLQFLDFWLSFLVIIMTCLYMAGFVGPKQGMMHIGCAVLTATIAQRNATSGWNVLVVVVMGVSALLLGWALESRKGRVFSSQSWLPRSNPFSTALAAVLGWTKSVVRQFRHKFRWLYLAAGLFFLFNAILSLYLEAARTYWIWHSWWHVSIYTCAFFMLYSVVPINQRPDFNSYEVMSQRYTIGDLETTELNPLPES
ncbi:hypothetical protein MPTK1_6g03270 [Marchantia polymorpha subsp. ruderalis]|uniref:EGF-like domain-containing protein n=2 Tax=Marchantia polymorpha TaxID=3197 RepID=A0AAF6BN31_MARPO|nr:hypothetical protein MARPO_0035s0107 [Marchantia polymorpha]BBN13415.1 hypothetical protein Mp_6g03270 [Marchantia polymorpha subsp. ruderalis]|eukprot:PTQ41339.1 hypothetical protein MARPO_0035s0107 [Marchantia polymorpha]